MIEIDGSYGEGGGQILRTSLALSAVTGKPVRIFNIRAKRKNPGLAHQHLTAVRAVASICNAEVRGAELRSTEIVFKPGDIQSGKLKFDIGTAGSVTLVLQALMPAAAFSPDGVRIEIRGGTDVPMAPPVDYLRFVSLPILSKFGYRAEIELLRRGHYPRGGGIVRAKIEPVDILSGVVCTERGKLREIKGLSHCVRLPSHVADRQARSAMKILVERSLPSPRIEREFYEPGRDPHLGPGSGITLWAIYDNTVLGASALGEKGKPAEVVGREAAENLLREIERGGTLDRYMTDQVIPYMALASGRSEFTSNEITLHALTNIWVVEKFLGVRFRVDGRLGERGRISVDGASFRRDRASSGS